MDPDPRVLNLDGFYSAADLKARLGIDPGVTDQARRTGRLTAIDVRLRAAGEVVLGADPTAGWLFSGQAVRIWLTNGGNV